MLSFKPKDFSAWLKGLEAKIELGRLLGQDQGIQVKNSDKLEPEDFQLCQISEQLRKLARISTILLWKFILSFFAMLKFPNNFAKNY